MTAPRVSVITATYNQGPYLAESIESALSQTGVSVEVIVIDDASTDDTATVLARYADRVRVIRLDKNCGGPAHPRNVGLRAAKGDYIAILDGDDVMFPGKLAEQVAFLDAHPDIGFVCANFRNFGRGIPDGGDELSRHPEFLAAPKQKLGERWFRIPSAVAFETLIGDNFVGVATVIFRREILAMVGLMDEGLRRSEDIEYWYRVARRYDFGYIDKVMAGRRLHGTNISASPAALAAKLEIYRRQSEVPMSARARRMRRRMMSKVHFALGFLDRQNGRRWNAVGHFASSMRLNFNGGRGVRSILATLSSRRG